MTSAYDMWDPEPPRCIECRSIVDLRQSPTEGAVGYCSTCDRITEAVYPDSQDPENREEDNDEDAD